MVTKRNLSDRNFRSFISIGILTTVATIKKLMFSKKMIGIILLCLIPIIVFSLWSGGAFPEDTELIHLNNYGTEPQLPGGIPDNDLEVSINESSINFEVIEAQNNKNIGELSFSGTSSYSKFFPVDHLEIQIFLQIKNFFAINLIKNLNESINDTIIGPIETEELIFRGTGAFGINDWSTWEFIWTNESLAFFIPEEFLDFAQSFGISEENIEEYIHFGFYIVGYETAIGNEYLVNSIYFELFPIFKDNIVSDYGLVGYDVLERTIEEDGYEIFMNVATFFFFLFIIPLISILFAISSVRDDIENHTIVYLITRPISKTEILFWKYKGFFISSWVPISISMCITFFIVSFHEGSPLNHIDYLAILLGIMTMSVLVYGALFFLFAIITPYPIVISLLYVFFWETIIPNQPNFLNRFSILYHIQTIASDTLGEIANVQLYQPINWVTSFFVLCGTIIAILSLTIYIFSYRDFT